MKSHVPLILCLLVGCSDGLVDRDPARKNPLALETTKEVEEFKGDAKVVDQEIEISNPITGALEAFEPTKQRLAILEIKQAVDIFQATEGRYPKDFDEFMQRVVKENNIRLPVLGPGFYYQYDVENHELVVVKGEKPEQQ